MSSGRRLWSYIVMVASVAVVLVGCLEASEGADDELGRTVSALTDDDAGAVDAGLDAAVDAGSDGGVDAGPKPVAVFSLRRAVPAYNGNALRVRRASDGAKKDIGFVGADLDLTALTAFRGTSRLTVDTWYDQSGALACGGQACDVTQTTVTSQPSLLFNAFGARPAIGCGGSNSAFQRLVSAKPLPLVGDHTIGGVVASYGSLLGTAFLDYDETSPYAGWGLGAGDAAGHSSTLAYWSSQRGVWVNGTTSLYGKRPTRLAATRQKGQVHVFVDGIADGTATAGTGSATAAPTSPLAICSARTATGFAGAIAELYAYPSALADADRAALDSDEAAYFPETPQTAYSGAAAMTFSGQTSATGQAVSVGTDRLAFERTQPWTAMAAVNLLAVPPVTSVILSNCTNPPANAGYSMWINGSCHLGLRLINDIRSNYLGVSGSVNLCDGQWHHVAASYDGSSRASGVKLYVDGNPDLGATVESDTLTGSIVASPQQLMIGNRANHLDYWMRGQIDEVSLHTVARSGAYVASHAAPGTSFAGDSAVALDYTFDDRLFGSTIADAGQSGFDGTMSSPAMWYPAAPPGPAAVFSMRRAVPAYAGYALRARRVSDGAKKDVGFVGDDLDIATLTSFQGSSRLTVDTWYDQSGAGACNGAACNVTQSSPVLQPSLILNELAQRAAVGCGGSYTYYQRLASAAPLPLTGDHTIGGVVASYGALLGTAFGDYDDAAPSSGWGLGAGNATGSTSALAYWSSDFGSWVNGMQSLAGKRPVRLAATRTGGQVALSVDAIPDGTSAGGNVAPTAPMTVCARTSSNGFAGAISEIYAFSRALGSGAQRSIDTNEAAYFPPTPQTAFAGTSALAFSGQTAATGEDVTVGTDVLAFERTQPWTAMAAVNMLAVPPAAAIVFSNASKAPAYPGYEMWVNSSCHLAVRLISDIRSSFIGKAGSIDLCNGRWHHVAATYDGSSLAAGVNLYVDGQLDPAMVVESDSLASNIAHSPQTLMIGNQYGHLDFWMRGELDEFSVHNVVRPSSYIAAQAVQRTSVPSDSNVVLHYGFDEGAGTSAFDSSSSNFTATVSSPAMWFSP